MLRNWMKNQDMEQTMLPVLTRTVMWDYQVACNSEHFIDCAFSDNSKVAVG
jgi:hypothetical protein